MVQARKFSGWLVSQMGLGRVKTLRRKGLESWPGVDVILLLHIHDITNLPKPVGYISGHAGRGSRLDLLDW